MKLYDWKNSYNSRKIMAVAFETDQRIDIQTVDMMTGANKTPEFLKMNPNGKVPVLEDGSYHLWESNAIMCYLASKDPSHRLLPTDSRQRADIDKWLFWQTAHLSPALGKLTYEYIWKARMNLGSPDQAAIDAAMPDVTRFLGVLDQCLTTHTFVAGDLSVADFGLAAAFITRHDIKLDLSNYKNITSWLGRIEARPSWTVKL